jgi:tetratricopeptide (TPR) repeat protein
VRRSRLTILALLAAAYAAGMPASAIEHEPHRIDPNLMKLTFADMLSLGFVDGTPHGEQVIPRRQRNRSARFYILAREAESRDNFPESDRLYQRATALDPGNIAAWEELGDLQYRIGNHRLAVESWDNALVDNDDADLLLKCGLLEAEQGLPDRSAEHLLRRRLLLDASLPVDNETVIQNASLLQSLSRVGNIDMVRALRDEIDSLLIEMAMKATGDVQDGKYWMRLIQDLHTIGDLRSARETARLRLLRGTLEGEHGPWISSNLKTRFILLDAIHGGSGLGTIELIAALQERGSLRGLPPDWRKEITVASALYEAGVDYATLGNQSGANVLFAEVLVHEPNHVLARNNLGYASMEHDAVTPMMVQMIESSLVDARAGDADSLAQVLDTVGWLRYMQGHFRSDAHAEGAVELLEASIERFDEPDPVVLDHLGDALWRSGRRDDAVESWMAALHRLNSPAFQEITMRNLGMLQGMIWQFRVADTRELYDREYGDLLQQLVDKLTAVEQGASPPVAKRILFIK